jgi:hypothetical protein
MTKMVILVAASNSVTDTKDAADWGGEPPWPGRVARYDHCIERIESSKVSSHSCQCGWYRWCRNELALAQARHVSTCVEIISTVTSMQSQEFLVIHQSTSAAAALYVCRLPV